MSMKNKLRRLKLLKSLNKLFLVLLLVAFLMAGLTILIFALKGELSSNQILLVISNALLIFPVGLFIVSIVALIITSVRLSKIGVQINDYSCLESLIDLDIVLLEKNGIITNGNLTIKKVIPLNATANDTYIGQWLSNLLRTADNDNQIVKALSKTYDYELSAGVVETLSYKDSSYFATTFKGGKTIALGELDYIPIKNKVGIIKRCEEHLNNGHRVLIMAEGSAQIKDGKYDGEFDALAIIILKDCIKDNALETFKWLKNNGVTIKVLSHDDAYATSVLCSEVGIDNANKYVSLNEIDNYDSAIDEYTVFGQANPTLKEKLIKAYKEKGYKVGVIGGTEEDISVLESADCLISVNAANKKEEADVVLNNQSFDCLLAAIKESEKVVFNLQRITSLFIVRSIFAFLTMLVFLLTTSNYPFIITNFLVLDVVVNLGASLLLLFENDNKKIKEPFLYGVFKNAIPVSALFLGSLVVVYAFYVMQQFNLLNLGIYTQDATKVMCTLITSFLGIVYLYQLCLPLTKFKKIVLVSISSLSAAIIFIDILVAYLTSGVGIITRLPYFEMSGPAYITTVITAVILAATYLFIYHLIAINKGDNQDNEN